LNPEILLDMVLSWHGDENAINPRTSLLLWRGTRESEPDKWNSFHKAKIEEKIHSIAADNTGRFSTAEIAAIQKIDFLAPSAPAKLPASQSNYLPPSANGFSA
ncbi:MAG: hypothetical protein HY370_01680, partial [Proteobacteria bacterium]|nr:hypothetical protein [Pseudomonadota bacterium]